MKNNISTMPKVLECGAAAPLSDFHPKAAEHRRTSRRQRATFVTSH
jgi:hypothetical protein